MKLALPEAFTSFSHLELVLTMNLDEQSESTPHIEITVDENLHPYVNIDIQDRVLTVG